MLTFLQVFEEINTNFFHKNAYLQKKLKKYKKMLKCNCVNRIVTLCDMNGGLHTFNIENEETFQMLGNKVKEKLQLEKYTHRVYFFNNEGIEKKHKNDKVNIVNSKDDSEYDFRFIVDIIQSIPICVEENKVYDLEITQSIDYNDIIITKETTDSEERRISTKTYKVSEDSFMCSMLDTGNFYNYLYTFDKNTNEWVSTRLPDNVFHVYPDGSYVEDERITKGYSYLNTTVYHVFRGFNSCLIIKNKDDNTEIPYEITDEIENSNRCFNWCIPIKFGGYILLNAWSWSRSEQYRKIYVIDAVTTSIIYIAEMKKDDVVIFIDNKHIGIIHKDRSDDVLYKINFLTGEIINSGDIIGHVGNIYCQHDNYKYGRVENCLKLFNQMFSNKPFMFIDRYDLGKIDILRIKND